MSQAQRFILFFVFSFLPFALLCQYTRPVPSWVKPVSVTDVARVKKNQVQDGYYYVLLDEQYHVPQRENFYHYALCAITEEALANVSQIEFRYDPAYQSAAFHQLLIHRGGKTIDRTKEIKLTELAEEREREEGILSGKKTLFVNLPDIRKEDIVEYSFSVKGENPIMKNHFDCELETSYSVPVGKIYHRLLFPPDVTPTIIYTKSDKQPEIKKDKLTEYSWTYDQPAIVTSDPSPPIWYSAFGNVRISTFKSWEEVKEHCGNFYQFKQFDKSELNFIVDSIRGKTNDTEKQITSIVQFVQSQVRYSGNENGIYSHVPRNPAAVLNNRFGDCKEKTVLLNELLKMIGIESYPALINTNLKGKVELTAPAIGSFNHVISAFEYKNQLYFIDPTISYQRGPFTIRPTPDYQSALVLNRPGEVFTHIPTDKSGRTEVLEEIKISENGDAELSVVSNYFGSSADDSRYEFLVNSMDQIQESYRKFYTRVHPKVIVIDTIKYTDNEDLNRFTITEKYILPAYWKPEDSTVNKNISKDFMPYSLYARLNFGEEESRKDPLKLSYPLNYSHTLTVSKAGGWDVSDQEKTDKNKFFDYSFIRKVNSEKVSLIYDYTSNTEVIAPEDFLNYKEKMNFINTNMVFSTTEQFLVPGTIGFNWALVFSLVLGAAACIVMIFNLRFKLPSFPFEKRYDSIGGWLAVLGISMIFGPLKLFYTLYEAYKTEMGVDYLVYYLNEKSPYFAPMTGYYNLFLPLCNAFYFVFSIYIVILFFQKRRSFRPYYTLYKVSNCVFLIANVIVLNIIYRDSIAETERAALAAETKGMVTVLIGTLIWVPYILYSDRSRYTFTNDVNTSELSDKNFQKELPAQAPLADSSATAG